MRPRQIPLEDFPAVLDGVILSYTHITDLTKWSKTTPDSNSLTETKVQQFCMKSITSLFTFENLLTDFKENVLPHLPGAELKPETKPAEENAEAEYTRLINTHEKLLSNTIFAFDENTASHAFMEKCLIHYCKGIRCKRSQAELLGCLVTLLGDKATQRIKIFIALEESVSPRWFISNSKTCLNHLYIAALFLNAEKKISNELVKLLFPFYLAHQKSDVTSEWKHRVTSYMPMKHERLNRRTHTISPENILFYRMNTFLDDALTIAIFCCDPEIIQQLAQAMNLSQCHKALEHIKTTAEEKEISYMTHHTVIRDIDWHTHRILRVYNPIEFYKKFPKLRSHIEAAYLFDQSKEHDADYVKTHRCKIKPLLTQYWQNKISHATLAELFLIYSQGINNKFINKPDSTAATAYYRLFTTTTYPHKKLWFIKTLQKKVCELVKNQPLTAETCEALSRTIFSTQHFLQGVPLKYQTRLNTVKKLMDEQTTTPTMR